MGQAVCGRCRHCVYSCSKSAKGLDKMMTAIIATVFEAAGLTVSEKKTDTMLLLRTPNQAPQISPFVIAAAGQKHRQTMQLFIPGRSCRGKR